MSITESDKVGSHGLHRGVLVGLLLTATTVATCALALVYAFDFGTTCEGFDNTSAAPPLSDQGRTCDALGGSLWSLILVVPALVLVVAVVVGVLWAKGRIHGAWVLAAVAATVLSPALIYKPLMWPSDAPEHPRHERTVDGA